MIQLTTIQNSSQVAAHGYDPVQQVLAIKFKNGGVYHYKGVEPEAAAALAGAESIGKHLYAHIRGKYQHERIADEANEDGPITTKDGATAGAAAA